MEKTSPGQGREEEEPFGFGLFETPARGVHAREPRKPEVEDSGPPPAAPPRMSPPARPAVDSAAADETEWAPSSSRGSARKRGPGAPARPTNRLRRARIGEPDSPAEEGAPPVPEARPLAREPDRPRQHGFPPPERSERRDLRDAPGDDRPAVPWSAPPKHDPDDHGDDIDPEFVDEDATFVQAAPPQGPRREGLRDAPPSGGRGGDGQGERGERRRRGRRRRGRDRDRDHHLPALEAPPPRERREAFDPASRHGDGSRTSARSDHPPAELGPRRGLLAPEPEPSPEEDLEDGGLADLDVPAWVEPEGSPEAMSDPARGRSASPGRGADLLPAGGGLDPAFEDPDEAPAVASAPRPPGLLPRARPPAYKRILINSDDSEEVRIAVLENGQLEELYYERPNEKKYLGNIYKGRVMNLEPAIQAAFVDLGIGRNGFLHVSDVLPAYKDATAIPLENLSLRVPDRRRLKIQDILRKGQEVLVQISKDSIGVKGPSLTTYVSVPGKYLVLMPGVSRHGVSKRIQDGDERSSLRDKLSELNPPKGVGYIVRTAGQYRPFADLEKDFQYLMKVWEEVRSKVEGTPPGTLVYAETDLVTRTMRDLFGPDVSEILIDDLPVYEQARAFLEDIMPQAAQRLKHYTGGVPLFSRFGVEDEIEKIYNRRVPLPSGGHIVLEQTEALVAIDVNSGKYRDEEDLEATALKTNLEAASEIARQLRLRDLGGVIVNDFIDMETEANRRAVERALRVALKRDRAKSWISRISRFGIIEMTRQRVRPSFERSNHEPCSHCRGTGVVKSARSTGIAILRQVRAALGARRRDTCEVVAHPAVVEYLVNERRNHLVALEEESSKSILVRSDATFAEDQYTIRYY